MCGGYASLLVNELCKEQKLIVLLKANFISERGFPCFF
jgi:hypothetical protein